MTGRDNDNNKDNSNNNNKNNTPLECTKPTKKTRDWHKLNLSKSEPHNLASYLGSYLQKETRCKKLRLDLPFKNSSNSTIYADGFGRSRNLFKISERYCSQSPGNSNNEGTPFFKITECSCRSNSVKDRKLRCHLTDVSPKSTRTFLLFCCYIALLCFVS